MAKLFSYINEKQKQFLVSPQKTKVGIMGRGTGKSFTIGLQQAMRAGGLSIDKKNFINSLDKAKFGLFGPTYEHLKNRVIPSMMQGIKAFGFVEHIEGKQKGHYVKFRKPPQWFDEPYQKPEDYNNIITFQNGYTIQLFSWHSADLIRGINLDGCDVDEAALLDKEVFDTVIFPTIRGNTYRFANNPLHQQICFYTSMPWLSSGTWLLNYEKLAKESPNDIAFIKATSWDNIAVLGRDTLTRWRREMTPLMYRVEIMCEEVGRVEGCYYNKFDEVKHCFVDINFNSINPLAKLFVSFDFNGDFCCCVVGQKIVNTIYIQRELFVKGGELLENLVDLICKEFALHHTKEIDIFGDASANQRNMRYVSRDFLSFYDKIKADFTKRGWKTNLQKLLTNPLHVDRHDVINKAFIGSYTVPNIKINKAGCTYLPYILVKTSLKQDFSKDKSSETDGHTPPEKATHLSDAFDYVVYRLCESTTKAPKRLIKNTSAII